MKVVYRINNSLHLVHLMLVYPKAKMVWSRDPFRDTVLLE